MLQANSLVLILILLFTIIRNRPFEPCRPLILNLLMPSNLASMRIIPQIATTTLEDKAMRPFSPIFLRIQDMLIPIEVRPQFLPSRIRPL